MFKFLTPLFLLLFAAQPVFAAGPAIDVRLAASADSPTVGQPFQITLTIRELQHGGGTDVQDIPIQGLDRFRQLGSNVSTQIQMVNGASAVVRQSTKTVVADRSGPYGIGPVLLRVQEGNSTTTYDVASNQLALTVRPAGAAETATPSTDRTDRSVPPWAIALGAGGAVGAVSFLMVKKFKNTRRHSRENGNPPSDPSGGPRMREDDGRIPSPDDPDFFANARKTLTHHLETARNIPADALTTSELIRRLEGADIPERADAITILQACDKARFAKATEDARKIHQLLTSIIHLPHIPV